MSSTTTKGRKRISFELWAEPGSDVFVAGTFNGWDPTGKRMTYKDGVYAVTAYLPPGRYEYKFVVDGTWVLDPECPHAVPNDQGTLNSVVVVE